MLKSLLRARYRRIVLFFASVVLSLLWHELILPRLGFRRRAQRTRSDRLRRIAIAFRELAIAMGGVMIKMGQFLSSRLDMLPGEITGELAGLQDAVPPEDFPGIRQVLEAELGAPIAARFLEFEETPWAAASLGQVHRARIAPNPTTPPESALTAVVVKVQRPHIEELIAVDLAALRVVAEWLQHYRPIRRRANVPALLEEFARTLYEEIDYLAEGRNAETFAANFQGRPGVRIPRVVWPTTTRRVLTLEDVSAIKITDYATITAAGVDRAAVARRLFDSYLQQIFEDGFFHADPHPGNLFVEPGPGGDWNLTFVDFGMVGRVSPTVVEGLREALIALGTRSAARLVKAYRMLDMLLPHADQELIERAEGRMFEHVWGKSMAELRQIDPAEMHAVAQEFGELFYDMPFQIPQDLIMLGRTVAILSGMCTGLDADFNLWEGLTPYAQQMLGGEQGRGDVLWAEVKRVGSALIALPGRFAAVLEKIDRGEVAVRMPQLTDHLRRIERIGRRLIGTIIFAALCLAGAQFYAYGQETLGLLMLVGAGIALAWVVFVR
jgi:predicted unusual protein kinase regulating ubiquinone biosynthesis (AarF/ABC1/UbiB family)